MNAARASALTLAKSIGPSKDAAIPPSKEHQDDKNY
jgi:hypothetical protein